MRFREFGDDDLQTNRCRLPAFHSKLRWTKKKWFEAQIAYVDVLPEIRDACRGPSSKPNELPRVRRIWCPDSAREKVVGVLGTQEEYLEHIDPSA